MQWNFSCFVRNSINIYKKFNQDGNKTDTQTHTQLTHTETETHTHHQAEVTAVQYFLCAGEDAGVQSLSKPNHSWSQETMTALLLTPETHTNTHRHFVKTNVLI